MAGRTGSHRRVDARWLEDRSFPPIFTYIFFVDRGWRFSEEARALGMAGADGAPHHPYHVAAVPVPNGFECARFAESNVLSM
jgi:hypothetical protein